MQQNFPDTRLFRLLCPPLYGLLVYVMVLLIFDNISHLQENFFSFEALLCILLTYLFNETMRLVVQVIGRISDKTESAIRLETRIGLQLLLSACASVAVTSLVVSAYFTGLLGFSTYMVELLAFNAIFLVTTLFYNLLYFSIFYLNERNRVRLVQEDQFRQTLEHQFELFRHELNPSLLYQSLETLISLVHDDPEQAETYSDQLASVYRYLLESRKHDLVLVSEELEALQHLLFILNERYDGHLHLEVSLEAPLHESFVVPGTLHALLECVTASAIVSRRQPLRLFIENDGDEYLLIRFRLNERLAPEHTTRQCLEKIQEAYRYFTDEPIVELKAYEEGIIKIPILQVEEMTP
jgi:sensor histidine kinase YesM